MEDAPSPFRVLGSAPAVPAHTRDSGSKARWSLRAASPGVIGRVSSPGDIGMCANRAMDALSALSLGIKMPPSASPPEREWETLSTAGESPAGSFPR